MLAVPKYGCASRPLLLPLATVLRGSETCVRNRQHSIEDGGYRRKHRTGKRHTMPLAASQASRKLPRAAFLCAAVRYSGVQVFYKI